MTACIEHSQGGNKQVYASVKRGGVSLGLHRLVYCEAKVPTELRAAIRGRVEAGEKPSVIAAELGISRSTVSYHIHGRKR